MSNYQDEIDFEGYKEAAESNGWSVPIASVQNDTANAWMSYWQQMEDYDERIAAGCVDAGRPLQPRSLTPT